VDKIGCGFGYAVSDRVDCPFAEICDDGLGQPGRLETGEGECEVIWMDQAVLNDGPETGDDKLLELWNVLQLRSTTEEGRSLQVEVEVGQ